jgi:ATP-binding cassette, subfamily C, bacterial CydD
MRDPVARRLARESRGSLLGLGALAVAFAGLVLAQAALLGGVLARGFDGAALAELGAPMAALAAVLAARAAVSAGFGFAGRAGALRAMSRLRLRLTERLLTERPADARSGELATAAVQGVDALEAWYAGYLPQVLLAALLPPAILAYVLLRDPAAAAVLAITVPVLIAFMILVGLAAQARSRARWRALSILGAHFADVVRGLATLRAHGRDEAQADTMDTVADRYRHETMGTLRVAFLSAFVLELAAMLGTALVAATVGLQLAVGHLELRDGLVVLLLAPELYAPLRAVGQQFHASADGLASAERILAVIGEPTRVRRAADGLPSPDPRREAIRLRAVSFAYEAPVLRELSLALEPGETVALVGTSGAGKSTLAAILLRLADQDAGRVSCGGYDLRDIDADAWRARIAWVPQRAAIIAGTVAENIALGAPDAAPAAIEMAARHARADAFVRELPDGYATRIGEGGRPLSAGEAQRIALARAFLRDGGLVILDEPTAHLDAATAAEIETAVTELCDGRTALVITHSPSLAARADRVVELREGRAVEHALEAAA